MILGYEFIDRSVGVRRRVVAGKGRALERCVRNGEVGFGRLGGETRYGLVT